MGVLHLKLEPAKDNFNLFFHKIEIIFLILFERIICDVNG